MGAWGPGGIPHHRRRPCGTTHRLLLPPGNYVSGSIQTLAVGNTEAVARRLQALTGADLFQLEPMQPYSDDYNECIQQAQDDQRRDARPP